MSTWILWSSEEKPEGKFPDNYLKGDPMDEYQAGTESEKCPQCEFTVRWMSDKYQFENYNDDIRRHIASILKRQTDLGECPNHPKPNWLA